MEAVTGSGRLLSVSEAAVWLGVSAHSVRRYVGTGELKASKLGPGSNAPIRIEERDLQRFLDRHIVERKDAA
jgi:excisionase family DNA binding protein